MDAIPPQLLANTSVNDGRVVADWWAGLSDAARAEITALWDRRQDECFFGVIPAASDSQTPVVIGGRFVPHDDALGVSEWGPNYFEHLLAHPEQVMAKEPVVRVFHFGCTQHPAAQAVLAGGHIPADFACPFLDHDCPMRRILDRKPGHDVQLVPLRSRARVANLCRAN